MSNMRRDLFFFLLGILSVGIIEILISILWPSSDPSDYYKSECPCYRKKEHCECSWENIIETSNNR